MVSGIWSRLREQEGVSERRIDKDRDIIEVEEAIRLGPKGWAVRLRFRAQSFQPRSNAASCRVTPWGLQNVVKFYNGRGTAEQWIKEGKNAVKWTKLSCRTFKDNQTRLQLFALAYNLANFLRRLALPRDVKHWSLTTLREKLVKIGAKVTRHSRYVTFQLAEVAVTRNLFSAILNRIARLAIPPPIIASQRRIGGFIH